MTRKRTPLLASVLATSTLFSAVFVLGSGEAHAGHPHRSFERVATFIVPDNHPGQEEAAAEIVAAADGGTSLLYTEGEEGTIGIVDISDPNNPLPDGSLTVAGSPTSVAVIDNYALVAVDTSASFVSPSGHLEVIDLDTLTTVATIDVHGQPDAVAISPDGSYAAIAVENERDEDLNDGEIPQLPAGHLAVISLMGLPSTWMADLVDLTDLASVAPSDPEPEFVSINAANRCVVSLQENNHLVVVDLPTLSVVSDFSAGSVKLKKIDTQDDGKIRQVEKLANVPREPDAVTWINDEVFATANEGDYAGGSRGFSLFHEDGRLLWDVGNKFDHLAASIGHYNDGRSDNKGSEPEAVTYGNFRGDDLLFVGSERGNFVAVYDLPPNYGRGSKPEFRQVLPTGVGPEGVLTIEDRDLLVVAAEKDDPDEGFRSMITIYDYRRGTPSYPGIVSKKKQGRPIPWGALSGLTGDLRHPHVVYGVYDSAYEESTILRMDTRYHPVRIDREIRLRENGETVNLDPEGICKREKNGFWIASEGKPGVLENELVRVRKDGTIAERVELPAETAAKAVKYGFEGVACRGRGRGEEVYVAFQREWDGETDGEGTNLVRIGRYIPHTGAWAFFHYPLDAPAEDGWVGLSELTYLGYNQFAVLERDNQQGPAAAVKRLYTFSIDGLRPQAEGGAFPVVEKYLNRDLLPDLAANGRWVPDKIEGLARTGWNEVFIVSDNDGMDDAVGETVLLTYSGWWHLGWWWF